MKVAIVGCGQIADAHVGAVRRAEGADVVAVCDQNEHMAEQLATRLAVSSVHTSLVKMLDDVHPDVVHVTTPPATHLAIGTTLAERGVHAYIEKPFTVTGAEAHELVDAARRKGVLICAGHNAAFDSSFLRLRRALDDGSLGELVHVDAGMGYNLAGPFGAVVMPDPEHWVHRLPGGLPHNNIAHPLSLVLTLLPDAHPKIKADGLRRRPVRYGDRRDLFFDELRVLLIGERATASVVFSCLSRPVQQYVTAHGSLAQAHASLDARTLRFVKGSSLPGPLGRTQWARQDLREARREAWHTLGRLLRARLRFFDGMEELVRRFYGAVAGKGPLPIPMEDAVRVVDVTDAIFAACREC